MKLSSGLRFSIDLQLVPSGLAVERRSQFAIFNMCYRESGVKYRIASFSKSLIASIEIGPCIPF